MSVSEVDNTEFMSRRTPCRDAPPISRAPPQGASADRCKLAELRVDVAQVLMDVARVPDARAPARAQVR